MAGEGSASRHSLMSRVVRLVFHPFADHVVQARPCLSKSVPLSTLGHQMALLDSYVSLSSSTLSF
jgi:hypothetical protein